jgi:hypothetical protein
MKTLAGIVRGESIEFAADLVLPDREEVEVVVSPVRSRRSSGAGLRRAAGAMAVCWTAGDDLILAEIEKARATIQRDGT